ncbi:MAG: hypothetical protein F6K31_00880 [Symploca sp. SIO2G7]|nr:hypothetical protein [Symploca sp. SIO2G7]
MQLSYRPLPYSPQTTANKLIQTALQKTISFFLVLIFTAAAIVALPVSVVLVGVAYPVFDFFNHKSATTEL